MSAKLLDPTLDIVFKLLFVSRCDLLRDMIEAVLGLRQPLREIEILNPEIPKDFPADKGVVLDIRVMLHDGRQIDLEMQSTVLPGTRARFLYYWARSFTDALSAGEDYSLLRPTISIVWFKERLLDGALFHSVFHLSEDQTREHFAPEIEFHVLELPKLSLAPQGGQAKLERWARFLTAHSLEDLERLAAEDAIMTTAKDALQELSSDPSAQRLAKDRETAVLMHRHLMAASLEAGLEQGRAEGRLEGRAEGRAEGLRGSLLRLLERRFGTLDPAVLVRINQASIDELEGYLDAVLAASSIDEVLRPNQ